MAIAQGLSRYGCSCITTLSYGLSLTGQPVEWFIWLRHSVLAFVLLAETSRFKMYRRTYFRLASRRLSELRPGLCSIESLLSPTGTFWNASDAPEILQNTSEVPEVWLNTSEVPETSAWRVRSTWTLTKRLRNASVVWILVGNAPRLH